MKSLNRSAAVVPALLALALVASACGAGSDQVAVPAPEETPPNSLEVPELDVEFGASVEEFGEATTDPATEPAADPNYDPPPGYSQIEWSDLVAPGYSDEDIWARFEGRLEAVEDGSPEANAIFEEMMAESDDAASVVPQMDGEKIQLIGFIAPLTYDGDSITEFLLVPYFGACIHVPPPPANQTIMVSLEEGVDIDDSWGAVLVTGTLSLKKAETDLAVASYTLSDATSQVYNY